MLNGLSGRRKETMRPWRAYLPTSFGLFSRWYFDQKPPEVAWLLEHRLERQGQTALTRGPPDSLASLYRMYEYLVIGFNIGLRSEIEHFFNQPSWSVKDIPDPDDPDPTRYAIVAVLPHYLIMAFNRLIKMGLPRGSPPIFTAEMEAAMKAQPIKLEEVPSWTAKVPPSENVLTIPCDPRVDERFRASRSELFHKMNIIVDEPHVLFV
ncbi:hypothetical protein E4U43_000371 [Claviceps pusilla]|uniref:Uncharacterized protein n=1 Tax=Claviceps pusilla TaxID=123648 RepID=A0A9P7NAB0_9HYPO|nr:hypothetical protein E4U43_000371 [Claviceps pusilla]